MSANRTKVARQLLQKSINFDRDTPRCGNCKNKVPGKLLNNCFQQATCGINSFYVEPNSLCDLWQDKVTGEKFNATATKTD